SENGETIYGTQAGPVPTSDGMASTKKGKTIYLHVLEPKENLFLEGLDLDIGELRLFHGKAPLKYQQNELGLLVQIPKEKLDTVGIMFDLLLECEVHKCHGTGFRVKDTVELPGSFIPVAQVT